MKIIQPAKFASTPMADWEHARAIQQPAEVEIGGIHLLSVVPKSAAEAMRINQALDRVAAICEE